jgi:ABC-type sulfate transport system permease subunit
MDILSGLITKYRQLLDRRHAKAIRRRQFNMTIDAGLVLGVKFLAIILKVPLYVITEHLLQVGSYHIVQALEDPEKRQELEKHLIEVHLLGSELQDDESILEL